jgi:dihydroorotate dehydrogenase electron transfer subunit
MTQLSEIGVASSEACGSYQLVRLDTSVEVGAPGRFAMLRDPEACWALPRPVSLFRLGDDTTAMLIDPRQRVGGLGRARRLTHLGPLGRGFDLDGADADTTLLVAGGIGISVLIGVPALLGAPPRLIAGFAEAGQAPAAELVDAQRTIMIAPRLVTEPLRDMLADGVTRVLACGPRGMVDAVIDACRDTTVQVQVALEAPMACGFGACHACVVRLDGGWRRLCLEGPCLDAARLR